jgi:uncharacterized protein
LLEQLRNLIELQLLEDKKAHLIRDCEGTPRRVEELEKEFKHFEAEYLERKAELDNAKKMHRSLEQGIAELETKIGRSKTRMGEVKTNKEYQAILKEIEDVKKDIGQKEDQALECMEKIEGIGKELKRQEKDVEVRRKVMEAERQVLVAESEKLKERLDSLELLEGKVRERLEPQLLKRCEFLMEKRSGVAVAAVESGVCQVCHLNIPPQKFIELQRDESIHNCPHCLRFLYWPGHESYRGFESDMEDV